MTPTPDQERLFHKALVAACDEPEALAAVGLTTDDAAFMAVMFEPQAD